MCDVTTFTCTCLRYIIPCFRPPLAGKLEEQLEMYERKNENKWKTPAMSEQTKKVDVSIKYRCDFFSDTQFSQNSFSENQIACTASVSVFPMYKANNQH